MNLKIISLITVITTTTITACNSSSDYKTTEDSNSKKDSNTSSTTTPSETGGDTKGIGKFKNVELTHPLDQKMIASGKSVYDVKCASCHKLSDEKLVGPGWKGVTTRRTPEWIMNFVTNTEEMLQKDVAAKNLYEICLVKMPNQNLKDEEARHVLEYMRENDGQK